MADRGPDGARPERTRPPRRRGAGWIVRSATLLLAGAVLFGGAAPASAQWRGGGPGGWARGPRGGDAPRAEGGWRGEGPGRGPGRGGGGFRADYAPGPGYGPERGGYGPGGGGGGRAWRRGQVLPPDYRGAAVADPGRYHLRRPPNGYGWVGDGRNAYLMQRSTGLVLDSVPGAYDPPPPYRGRRR